MSIEVVRVEPLEIPADIVWQICAKQKIALKDFYVYVQEKENKMYVNKSIPKKDIKKMIEVMTSPAKYIADDDDSETGKFLDYVYEKYGFAAYYSLVEYHQHKREQEEDQRAEDQLQEVLPLIEEIVTSEFPAIHYNESLIYEVWKKGGDRKGKTVRNKIGYDDVYVFYLGCLVGMGKVNADDYSLDMPVRVKVKHDFSTDSGLNICGRTFSCVTNGNARKHKSRNKRQYQK